MEKRFASRPGLEIIIPISLVLVLICVVMLTNPVSLSGLFIVGLLVLFLVYLFINTSYTIKDETLYVKCGFLYNSQISIKSITKITETANILSSPATSIHRLEIVYNKFDSVQISPKDKDEFIQTIKMINPKVEVAERKNKKR